MSQTKPDTQFAVVAQTTLQVPTAGSHVYGAQLVAVPLPSFAVEDAPSAEQIPFTGEHDPATHA
ncbi:MAG: hypothetical protein ACHREM_05380 [Polyangiales bacterium]